MNTLNINNKEKFYSVNKLSELTGISESLIRYWKHQKKIPFIQESPGSAILIPFNRFNEYLEKNMNLKESI